MDYINITIYALLIFAFFILIKFLFNGDSKYQRVFGGVIVLLVALASKNPWAISLSIFIGGLIIASENFMKFFAAIMKTRGDKVADTVKAFQTQKIPKKEINVKLKNEIKEISAINELASKNDQDADTEVIISEENVALSENKYNDILPKIEKSSLDKLENSLGEKIDRQMGFTNLAPQFDGSIVNNNAKHLKFIEVKTFPKLPKNKHGKVMAFSIVNSIKQYLLGTLPILDEFLEKRSAKGGWRHTLTVVVVLNTKTDFVNIKKRIEILVDECNVLVKNIKVNFVFYNLKNLNLDLEEK